MSHVCTSKLYKEQSIKAAMERNDCVVRAIASAFEIPYDTAHSFIEDVFKRSPKKGTRGTVLKMRNLQETFGKRVVELGEIIPELDPTQKLLRRWYNKRGTMSWGCYTTERFIEKFPEGTYIVFISRHAFTIRDGVIYGNADDATKLRARILQAFKVG